MTLDLSKINKEKVTTRTFTNKDGEEITSKDYKIEAVALTEPKVIKEGDTWQMVKTHFIIEAPTKEERESKVKTPILGDGIQFMDKVPEGVDYPVDDEEVIDLPF